MGLLLAGCGPGPATPASTPRAADHSPLATAHTSPLPASPLPTVLASPQALPPFDAAPDFTLQRAGGEAFSLAEQLTRGPVVVVFFHHCG